MQRNWRLTRAAFTRGSTGEPGGGAMPVGRVAARAKKKLLGGSSGSFGKGSGLSAARVRERASLSFFLVLLFFGVFGLIVLTEILFIDGEAGGSGPGGRGRAVGVPGSRGRGGGWGRRHGGAGVGLDAPDYEVEGGEEEAVVGPAAEDYFIYRGFRAAAAGEGKSGLSKGKSPVGGDGNKGKKFGFRVFPKGDAEEPASAPVVGAEDDAVLATEGKLPPVKDAEWQPVKGTRFKFYVYSAYYDSRGGERMVRIIGATRTRSPEKVWCRLWLSSSSPANFTMPSSSQSSVPSGSASSPSSGNSTESHGESRLVATVLARVKVIRENWNLKYSACFVICPLRAVLGNPSAYTGGSSTTMTPEATHKGEYSTVRGKAAAFSLPSASGSPTGPPPWPLWVSVVSRSRRAMPAHRLRVRNTEAHQLAESRADSRFGDRWGVCIKPLHFSYNQALHMVEFIEFHSLLGFEHFTMYNHTVGPAVGCILNHYAQKGTVTLLPWSLDMASQREIRTEGLFAALNDCLYRSMHRFRYLALIDLDEFIVPRKFQHSKDQLQTTTAKSSTNPRGNNTDSSLADLLASLVARAPAAGAFSFQNAFFYLQWADDDGSVQSVKGKTEAPSTTPASRSQALNPEKIPALVTQRKTRRRARAHPHKQRSKYICRPERVVEAGNHFVWEFTSGGGGMGIGGGSIGAVHVPSDAALLHHYRVCEFGGDDCIRTAASVVDRTAQRFRDPLLKRVAIQWAEMREPCALPPLIPGEGGTPHR